MASETFSNKKFFSLNRRTGEYSEYNPTFYKYTREGRRVPYTFNDLSNNSIQPYDKYDFEVIIAPIKGKTGQYKVSQVRSEINMNNNENVVEVSNILGEYPERTNERMAEIKHKYKRPNSDLMVSRSYITDRQQVFTDLAFLFSYYTKLMDFYKAKIMEAKGQEVLDKALKRGLSYLNVVGRNQNALTAFNNYLKDDLVKLDEIANRYPALKLSNPRVYSNPVVFYQKVLELKHDLEEYFTLLEKFQESSQKTMSQINARLKSMKRRRNNNNSNNSEPAPKKFTLKMPPIGGRRKTHKQRN